MRHQPVHKRHCVICDLDIPARYVVTKRDERGREVVRSGVLTDLRERLATD